MSYDLQLIGTATTLAAIVLCSVPSLSGFARQLRGRDAKQEVYEDADGKSTPESVRAYSARLPKAAILLFAALACASSLATAVLVTLHFGKDGLFLPDWLCAAASILLLAQAVTIASSRNSLRAYNLGLYCFISSITLAVILLSQDAKLLEVLLHEYPVLFALRVVQLFAVVALAIFSLAIPRRPDVYDENGQMVDRMFTATALSRFQFLWPGHVLQLASAKKNLDLADLPRPNHYSRAREVSKDWKRLNYKHRLWLCVARAHADKFALQWLLTLGTAILNFAPQWVILQLLRRLEERVPGQSYGIDIWMWVVWLGIAIVSQAWLENYVFWLSWAQITIPIRSQLSALIFEKAMRRKDVKGTGKSEKKAAVAAGAEPTASEGSPESTTAAPAEGSTAPDRPEVTEEEEDESEAALKKSKQGTVNLIGVDGKRVADFCSYQNFFPGSLFKLIVSLTFLVSLLGWKPLGAGFLCMAAIMPVNIFFSKRYSNAQDRLMKLRDEKLEVVTEALQGIRQIKFSALEPEWEKKVGDVRKRELGCVWDVFLSDTVLIGCWVASPIALSAVSLAIYAIVNGELKPSVAFVSLGVFRALEVTLSVIPELTTDLLDAWISINRIEKYLQSPDLEKSSKAGQEVTFDGASIAWPADENTDESERFVLRDVTVTFPPGELSVISGKTGTGKTLMLAAILGEVDVLAGSLHIPKGPSINERHDSKATKANWIIPNSIAYIAQIPWIENASIKDNITFGLPLDEDRYQKTIEVCALKKDLEMLSDGENTEIGANGINLSGGQKWRVTLARAVYSRAGILVMDDIFSAVDAHVGRHIFEKCLNGELCAGRTRILVTHHVALCEPKTKYLVELGEGRVQHAGLLSELQEDGTLEQIKSHEQTEEEIQEDEAAAATAVNSDDSTDDGEENGDGDGEPLKKVPSKAAAAAAAAAQQQQQQQAKKFVEEEKREEGAVKQHIYRTYLKDSGGWPFWLSALLLFLVVQAMAVGRSWWLRIWTGNYEAESADTINATTAMLHREPPSYGYVVGLQHHLVQPAAAPFSSATRTSPSSSPSSDKDELMFYLGVYVAISVVSAIIGTFRYFYIYLGSIRASRILFAKLNFVILRAPLRWLDTVPVGRILNRFTADFHIIDSQLANSLSFGAGSFIQLIGVVAAGLLVSPYIVLVSLGLLPFCIRFAFLYLNAARPTKRLESNAKSPVFEQFGSALMGVSTIRGFDKSQVYIERMYKKLDDWATTTWHLWLFNRWVGWRMSLVGSVYSVVVTILILSIPNIDSALAGFALAFALEFANCVMWTIRLYANVELNMNAAERIIEYTELPTESLEGAKAPAAWPTEGRIEVSDLHVGYAPDLPDVLKGLTFRVNRNERVGVVGRTGAGKSSLTLALFRFLEARSGSIHVDGIDISKINLHDLRSRLAIIPQDPVLFSGTVRTNLDPFDNHTDAELRDCLERVHLTSSSSASSEGGSGATTPTSLTKRNANVFENLQSSISEGGLNLSQGQRQLLCLARAIVSRPRVMVLDEATSAVDMATDALIQRSIREEFTDSTLLVIAHRLSTIADFDRILVLSDGAAAEFGTPRELWEKGPAGMFRAMCDESGEKEKLRRIIFHEEGPSSS